MKKVDWLIVGLGNPGKKYVNTRHNIGWMVGAALAAKYKKPIMSLDNDYMQAALRIGGELVVLILPTTYMNNSGMAVKSVADDYSVPADKILVISDEYNFPLGRIHLKTGGSDGGHNGVESVIYQLETEEFVRLRMGIDKKFGAGELVDYVLSDFGPGEIPLRDEMIEHAVLAIEHLVLNGAARAMSAVNSGKLWKTEEEDNDTD